MVWHFWQAAFPLIRFIRFSVWVSLFSLLHLSVFCFPSLKNQLFSQLTNEQTFYSWCHGLQFKTQSLSASELLSEEKEFCNWLVNMNNTSICAKNHFYSDEAWFHLNGYIDSQNMRIWSDEKPHEFIDEPLQRQKIGVWAATGHRYWQFWKMIFRGY